MGSIKCILLVPHVPLSLAKGIDTECQGKEFLITVSKIDMINDMSGFSHIVSPKYYIDFPYFKNKMPIFCSLMSVKGIERWKTMMSIGACWKEAFSSPYQYFLLLRVTVTMTF